MASVTTLRSASKAPAREDGLLTLEAAAVYLQIAPGTLKRWAIERRIEHVKVGRLTRFTKAALDRYIASQTVAITVELP